VSERDQRLGHTVQGEMPAREIAVARIAARPDAFPGEVERAVDRREAFRLEPHTHATSLRHLAHVPEEAEAGDVGHRVHGEWTEDVRGILVQRLHPADRSVELLRARL